MVHSSESFLKVQRACRESVLVDSEVPHLRIVLLMTEACRDENVGFELVLIQFVKFELRYLC